MFAGNDVMMRTVNRDKIKVSNLISYHFTETSWALVGRYGKVI